MSQAGRFLLGGGGGGTPIETIRGNVGGPVPPDAFGNIDILGTGDITVTGFPGANTLTIELSGAIANEYVTDSGSAIPALGILNVLGGTGITTSAVGNTITIDSTVSTGITINGDVSFVTGSTLTFTGGTSGAVFTGNGTTTMTESFNFLALPVTTATNGQIRINTLPYLHAYGLNGVADHNVFVGDSGNFTINGGAFNNGVGSDALRGLTTGNQNNAFGHSALVSLTTGSNNLALGDNALSQMTTGNSNIVIGNSAATTYTGAENNNIIIGNLGIIGDTNTTRIGSGQTTCFVAGINGISVGSVASVVSISGDQLGTTTITAGTGITVTPGANTITIAGSGTTTLTYTNVTTTPYVVLTTDQFLSVNTTTLAITIQLPNAPATGRVFIIKDRIGNAAANNITVTTVGGAVLIDGAATFVMNTAFQSIQVLFNGTSYEIF